MGEEVQGLHRKFDALKRFAALKKIRLPVEFEQYQGENNPKYRASHLLPIQSLFNSRICNLAKKEKNENPTTFLTNQLPAFKSNTSRAMMS